MVLSPGRPHSGASALGLPAAPQGAPTVCSDRPGGRAICEGGPRPRRPRPSSVGRGLRGPAVWGPAVTGGSTAGSEALGPPERGGGAGQSGPRAARAVVPAEARTCRPGLPGPGGADSPRVARWPVCHRPRSRARIVVVFFSLGFFLFTNFYVNLFISSRFKHRAHRFRGRVVIRRSPSCSFPPRGSCVPGTRRAEAVGAACAPPGPEAAPLLRPLWKGDVGATWPLGNARLSVV